MPDHSEDEQSCARAGWERRAIAELAESIRRDLADTLAGDVSHRAIRNASDAAAANIWELFRTPFGKGSPAKDYLGWRMLGGIAVDVMPSAPLPPGAVGIMPLGNLAAYFRANLDRLELENVSADDLAG